MDAITLMKQEVRWAHDFLEMVTADITQAQLEWIPPGIANPAAAVLAHAVTDEDFICALLSGKVPLYKGSWAGRTGVSDPRLGMSLEWARSVKVDLAAIRSYIRAVYAEVDSLLASLTEADLDRALDLSNLGFETRSLGWALTALLVSHTNNMIGELSCLKGLQGARGYPF
ncbi:MAG TPA: DinB family protein [Anaerolineales bacterium]|nr:DinB family protein [Anaerolineales bacterium]